MAAVLRPLGEAPGDLNGLRERLLDLMWEDVGVIRDGRGLNRAKGVLEGLDAELMETGLGQTDLRFNLTWHDWLNLESQIRVSKAITQAALKRENSRGAHYREDFASEGEYATSRYTVVYDDNGGMTVADEAVEFSIVSPGESLIEADSSAAQ